MDNKPFNCILKIAATILLILSSNLAYAMDNIKIAVVDVQKVLDSSVAVIQLRKDIDKLSEKLHKEMSAKETELKAKEAALIKKKATLKSEAFDAEVNDFYKEVSKTQHQMQKKKSKLEQSHAEAVNHIHENTLKIIAKLSAEKKINLVVPISQILYTDKQLTITQEVIDRLNNQVKSISLKFEE